jgi:uncharacterized OsmC-like protein
MEDDITVELELEAGYNFKANFGNDWPYFSMDEPAPLGENAGPNAVRVLAAAVGNCLSASALYCLRRSRIEVSGLTTTVTAKIIRNEKGRLRIGGIHVRMELRVHGEEVARMRRCLDIFEDFCVVTQSVRDGIDVNVAIETVPVREPATART